MIVIMQNDATESQIQNVTERLVQEGFRIHRSEGVECTILGAIGDTSQVDPRRYLPYPGVRDALRISVPYKLSGRTDHHRNTLVPVGDRLLGGEQPLLIMGGPCSVESEEQIHTIAASVKAAGATVLRGGAFKPRTSPYSFQGLGPDGLRLLREAADAHGLQVISEMIDHEDLDLFEEYVDIIQVGARNMQNYRLLRVLGRSTKPVMLKRGPAATIEEWLLASEYILSEGNSNVILCERGIRTYERATRNTLDLSAVPLLLEQTHLPVVVDPSHGTGVRGLIRPMARAAVAAGAHGLIVEVHHQPEKALSDGQQALLPDEFKVLVTESQRIATAMEMPFANAGTHA